MINIYTDASYVDNKAVTVGLILSDKAFIGCVINEQENVISTLQAELISIRDSLRYLNKNKLSDETTLYCDSMQAVDICNEKQEPLSKYKKITQDIINIKCKYNVNIKYIKGHQYSHNSNKIVDLLGKSILAEMR